MQNNNRIKEVIFKNGTKEYYPQIKIDKSGDLSKSLFKTEDGWMWVRKNRILKNYELIANDFECACKTKEDAVEVIRLYYKQLEVIEESNRFYFEQLQKRENSIKETNYLKT